MKLVPGIIVSSLLIFPSIAKSDFLWGVASSSFQVEGSPANSDWSDWTQTPAKILDQSNANTATDFWNRHEEDFKIAQSLGLKAYRFSIAWERVFPAQGQIDQSALQAYKKIVRKMRHYGLEPIVTLHHFVLPKWLVAKGGLLSDDFVGEFSNYTEHVVKFLSETDDVKYWITFNEPNVLVNAGYVTGEWPPGKKGDMTSAVKATAQLIRAHAASYNIIKTLNKSFQVSIAHHWRVFESKSSWNPLDWIAAKLTDKVWNDQIVKSLLSGRLDVWMPGGGSIKEDISLIQNGGLDFLGVNYYGRSLMSFHFKSPFVFPSEGPGEKSDLGWEIFPQGLETGLEDIYARYKLPIMITENGLADSSDKLRAKFLEDHVAALRRAQSKGVPILGYLHWSLTDNFEWAHGLKPRFGLVEIDYTQKATRKLRPSANKYSELIKQNSL